MNTSGRLRILGVAALLLVAFSPEARPAFVGIPLDGLKTPADDLVYPPDGERPTRRGSDRAIELARQGVDLSALEPKANLAWQPNPLPLVDATEYPGEETPELWFEDTDSGAIEHSRTQVSYRRADGEEIRYRLVASLALHGAFVRAGLLRKLGYGVTSPKYYRTLTLRFRTAYDLKRFLDNLSISTTFSSEFRWVRNKSELVCFKDTIGGDWTEEEKIIKPEDCARLFPNGQPVLRLRDVSLERSLIDVPNYTWGSVTKTHVRGRRAQRALVVPLALAQVPETVNRLSWEGGTIYDNNGEVDLMLEQANGEAFQGETTREDARWVMWKIAQLTRDDWKQLVALGHFPPEVDEVVVEKLVARRNHLVKALGFVVDAKNSKWTGRKLPKNLWELPYNAKLTTKTKVVKKGKVMRTPNEDDYASRFTHGDPISPLRPAELARFLTLEGISFGIGELMKEVNERLAFQTVSDLAEDRQKDLAEDALKHFQNNPFEPYKAPLGMWGGPVGGIRLAATRNVVTGSYYGTDAKVQMVDRITASGSVGWFFGFDNFDTVVPGFGVNVTAQRDFLHIVPIPVSTEEKDKDDAEVGMKRAFKERIVFFGGIAKTLERQSDERGLLKGPDLSAEQRLSNKVQNFMDALKPGEMFVVSDSLSGTGSGQVNIPILALLGVDPIGVVNKVTAAAAASQIIYRRTTFYRSKEGIQVYIQRFPTTNFDIAAGMDWWMNVVRLSHSIKRTKMIPNLKNGEFMKDEDFKVRAYLFDDLMQDSQKDDAEAKEKENAEKIQKRSLLYRAIGGLLAHNNAEMLEERFNPYRIAHNLAAHITRFKLLRWHWDNVGEVHKVVVRHPDATISKNEDRTLISHRITQTHGTNDWAFLSDIVEAAAPGYGFFKNTSGDNPASYPLGKGRWRNVITDAEVTPGHRKEPVTVIENHWGGWILTMGGFKGILEKIRAKMGRLFYGDQITFDPWIQQIFADGQGLLPVLRKDVFTSTGSFHLYDLMLLTAVSAKGFQSLVKVVFPEGTDLQVMDALLKLWDNPRFESWCASAIRLAPVRMPKTRIDCAPPWMRKLMRLRNDRPKGDEAEIVWQNSVLAILEKNIPLERLVTPIGRDNIFVQIHVKGFRTSDEYGDQEYVSDTIGRARQSEIKSVMQSFSDETRILSSEVRATYLSEGFL